MFNSIQYMDVSLTYLNISDSRF